MHLNATFQFNEKLFCAGGEEEDEGEMDFFPANMADFIPDEEALTGIKGELENQEQISSTIGEAAKGRREALNALKAQVSAWKQHEYVTELLTDTSVHSYYKNSDLMFNFQTKEVITSGSTPLHQKTNSRRR